jgi:hypothetical protein
LKWQRKYGDSFKTSGANRHGKRFELDVEFVIHARFAMSLIYQKTSLFQVISRCRKPFPGRYIR